jgi:predicted secreted protein
MSLTLALALYFIIWWTVLFAVLPIGMRTQEEDGNVVAGTPESAPAAPKFWRIIVLNSILSAAVLAVVWLAIVYKLVPLERLF